MAMLDELEEAQLRQYIDAESSFRAWEQARREAAEVRGSMVWREQHGRTYLLRVSSRGSQTSLGAQSPENVLVYERFQQRKKASQDRFLSLKQTLDRHVRVNRALRLGRVPNAVIDVLSALSASGLADQFLVVGTHALYAYEMAAGVRISSESTATQDIDLLMDARRMVQLKTQLERLDSSFLSVLRKADPTYVQRHDQRYTAVNAKGFEVDVLLAQVKPDEPHPIRLSEHEDDLWPVQASTGHRLLNSERFEQVVVATNGHMVRMRTVHPLAFIHAKLKLAGSASRDPLKRRKDKLQADIAQQLWDDYLQHRPVI